ncbi:MAG TPA: hydroxymethylglutaryl-CoA lyase [Vicinamibacterales bacterium]|jgi:hydroxymethylglutaryl-CoA lyase|nr:hydroxymethylglutaryl-CoA lyase [Vicinamibacterales bacterium]
MTLPSRVRIVEVGPRDGLQNEQAAIAVDDKVRFVDMLGAAGHSTIEVGAFVSPRGVPQMADTADVFARIARRAATRYTALVPNLAGLDRALAARADEIAVFAAASESFSRRNINRSIDASLETYRAVCSAAREAGLPVRAYVSAAFGCPFEGAVDPARVRDVSAALVEMGAYEVSVSDTIGVAHPGQVPVVLSAVAERVPLERIALHFHDTRGTALANVLTALRLGVATYDSSAGGLGGCPYAPGATGNLATEDLLYMLNGLNIETGVSLPGVLAASRFIEQRLGHPLASRYAAATRSAG